jgi:hypothetical protein
VLIEGAGFTCQLSAARWKLSEEAHRWSRQLKERDFDDLPLETLEDDEDSLQDLNRTRWSLAEAMENAGLANHMGSAAPDWLKAMRSECSELRREIRILTHEFEEPCRASSSSSPSPVEADPHSA